LDGVWDSAEKAALCGLLFGFLGNKTGSPCNCLQRLGARRTANGLGNRAARPLSKNEEFAGCTVLAVVRR